MTYDLQLMCVHALMNSTCSNVKHMHQTCSHATMPTSHLFMVMSCSRASPHAPNLLVVIVHVHECSIIVLKQHAQNTCSDRMLRPHAQLQITLKLDGLKVSCHDHGSKNAPHARIPDVQNENHVLVEVVEATAMMHHTQLVLQDVYNHHCRYVEMASHLHITVH